DPPRSAIIPTRVLRVVCGEQVLSFIQITRSPDHPITQFQSFLCALRVLCGEYVVADHSISRSPDHPISALPPLPLFLCVSKVLGSFFLAADISSPQSPSHPATLLPHETPSPAAQTGATSGSSPAARAASPNGVCPSGHTPPGSATGAASAPLRPSPGSSLLHSAPRPADPAPALPPALPASSRQTGCKSGATVLPLCSCPPGLATSPVPPPPSLSCQSFPACSCTDTFFPAPSPLSF